MKLIKRGDKGDEVLILQRLLRKLNLLTSADGDFGGKTDMAIRKFQANNGLTDDGIVGNHTWDKVFAKASSNILGTDIYHGDITDKPAFYSDLDMNYWFCFAKASQGSARTDPRFKEHITKLKSATILRGAYHFIRFLNTDIDGEINNFLNACQAGGLNWSDKGVLPPVLDIEPIGTEFNEPTKSEITANRANIAARAKKWLTTVEARTGKTPIIYTTRYIWDEFLKAPQGFERYPLWVADYGGLAAPRMPSTWNKYAMWQYSEKGKIGGNDGFDLNKLNIPLKDLFTMAGY